MLLQPTGSICILLHLRTWNIRVPFISGSFAFMFLGKLFPQQAPSITQVSGQMSLFSQDLPWPSSLKESSPCPVNIIWLCIYFTSFISIKFSFVPCLHIDFLSSPTAWQNLKFHLSFSLCVLLSIFLFPSVQLSSVIQSCLFPYIIRI